MKAPRSLKVLTLNTHKGFSSLNRRFVLHDLREAIRSVSADIVFLQEVSGENSKRAAEEPSWPKQSQYEFLADSIWSDFAYGKNAVYPEGHHGNAILSKFPIEQSKHHDISTYALEQRGFLHCEVKFPGSRQNMHAICIHLGLFGFHRKQQLKMIDRYVMDEIPMDAPLLIAGDFNDWSRIAEREWVETLNVQEMYKTVHGRLPRTFPVHLPLLHLDRVYARGFQCEDAVVLNKRPWTKLSDHAGVLCELRQTK